MPIALSQQYNYHRRLSRLHAYKWLNALSCLIQILNRIQRHHSDCAIVLALKFRRNKPIQTWHLLVVAVLSNSSNLRSDAKKVILHNVANHRTELLTSGVCYSNWIESGNWKCLKDNISNSEAQKAGKKAMVNAIDWSRNDFEAMIYQKYMTIKLSQ